MGEIPEDVMLAAYEAMKLVDAQSLRGGVQAAHQVHVRRQGR